MSDGLLRGESVARRRPGLEDEARLGAAPQWCVKIFIFVAPDVLCWPCISFGRLLLGNRSTTWITLGLPVAEAHIKKKTEKKMLREGDSSMTGSTGDTEHK